MTNTAQYNHISSSLNSVHEKIEKLNRDLAGLTGQLAALKLSTQINQTIIPLSPVESGPINSPILIGMKSHCIFGPTSTVLDLSNDISNIEGSLVFATLVGGGGAGSTGLIKDKSRISGAGGGGGETIHRRIISLYGCTGRLIITVGAGGDNSSPDGGYTSVEPEIVDLSRHPIVAHGGKGGKIDQQRGSSIGGDGAQSETYKIPSVFDGQKGDDGQEETIPSPVSIQGGSGGNSYFTQGGFGGYSYYVKDAREKTVLSPKGQDGSFGSGGGGSIPGIHPIMVGKGGHGMVIIEYSLKG
jgi:hypothetical protein